MKYSIKTKIAKIEKGEPFDMFFVKATVILEDGREFQAIGQELNDTLSVVDAMEYAEDKAVYRAKKLAGIKDDE